MKDKGNAQKMNTLVQELNKAIEEGYKENFSVEGKSLVIAGHHKRYSPDQIGIFTFFRFEGYSDPEDNAILYVIETDDGTRGTLIDAYGLYADDSISKFVHDVKDINKEDN